MPDVPTKVYENAVVTVAARIPEGDADHIEDVTFKFYQDGELFDEETATISEGGDDSALASYDLRAPEVPEDQDSYRLDSRFFYKIKLKDGTTEARQDFSVRTFEVYPRTARLKVTRVKDGEPFTFFHFTVLQDGQQVGGVQSTVAKDTANATGETIPAGTAEFNLGLESGFRILALRPFEITEEVVGSGRQREIKGDLKPRVVFIAPEGGNIRQYVNEDVLDFGQTGSGSEVTVEVGVEEEDLRAVTGTDVTLEVHFRVTYGPADDEPVVKSARDDSENPTKALKVSDSDTTVTIEEKEAGKKYQGKVELTDGRGKLKVALGKAGGDTCLVEISGSDQFLDDDTLSPDATLSFENWRRVHYELMAPDVLLDRGLDPATSELPAPALRRLDELGRELFIEFIRDETHVFDTIGQADYGTLAPRRFLGEDDESDVPAYVLSGRNWRELPSGQEWTEEHLGKTLCIALSDRLLKWRQDTDDEKAGTKDFSGTMTEATAFIAVEENFEGLFMPFSGNDAGDGIENLAWTADISKDDEVCKYTPELTLEEDREDETPVATGLPVVLDPDEALPVLPERVVFTRLPYPALELSVETVVAEEDEEDDGKVTVKEPVLGKELELQFEVPEEEDEKAEEDEEGEDEIGEWEEQTGGTSSDWGSDQGTEDETDPGGFVDPSIVTTDHEDQLDSFFKDLFSSGADQLKSGDDTNKFQVEIHGTTGTGARSRRIMAVRAAVQLSYGRTFDHDKYDFESELTDTDTERIQAFVDALLAEPAALYEVEAKIVVHLRCPKGSDHGEDDGFTAVKDKLQELFDATQADFVYHPGLDPENEYAAREGVCSLAEITDVEKSTVEEWHFELPAVLEDGTAGPGSYAGAEKTRGQCPVKFELSFQPHEESPGEAEGKLLAWATSGARASHSLVRLVLQGFAGTDDESSVDHGHTGDEGMPGDCLVDGETLCTDCVDHGRSRDLTVI